MLTDRRGRELKLTSGWTLLVNTENKTLSLFDENGVQAVFENGDDKFFVSNAPGGNSWTEIARMIAWSHGLVVAPVGKNNDKLIRYKLIEKTG